jgi:hypothetical protein
MVESLYSGTWGGGLSQSEGVSKSTPDVVFSLAGVTPSLLQMVHRLLHFEYFSFPSVGIFAGPLYRSRCARLLM